MFVACSSKSPNPAASGVSPVTPSSSGLAQGVTIKDFSFTPSRLTVKAGTRIAWTQTSTTLHTVTSGTPAGAVPDGKFSSGDLKHGVVFPVTLTTPGAYTYFCSHHPDQMHGTIIVQ